MVLPAWTAVGTADTTGTASSTPAYGANSAGDLPLLVVAGRITSVDTPTGFVPVPGSPHSMAGRVVYLFTRTARFTGGEAGTITITLNANSQISTIHTLSNVELVSFIEDVTTGGSDQNGNIMDCPTIVAGGTDRLGLFVSSSGTAVTYVSPTGETGGDWILRAQATTGTGSNCDYGLFTADLPSGGTISGGSATITAIDEYAILGLALVGTRVAEQNPMFFGSFP